MVINVEKWDYDTLTKKEKSLEDIYNDHDEDYKPKKTFEDEWEKVK